MNNIICYNVASVTKEGVVLDCQKNKIYIDFADCAKNFSLENNKFSKCVATRDITTLTFIFYTQPKTKVIFKKCFLKEFIGGKTAVNKFLNLQKFIIESGYTSYDLS